MYIRIPFQEIKKVLHDVLQQTSRQLSCNNNTVHKIVSKHKNFKWYYMPILRNLLPQLIKNRMIKAAHTLWMICNCSKSRNTIRTCSKTYNIFLIPFPGFSTYVKHFFKILVVLRICQKYLSWLQEVQEFY